MTRIKAIFLDRGRLVIDTTVPHNLSMSLFYFSPASLMWSIKGLFLWPLILWCFLRYTYAIFSVYDYILLAFAHEFSR